MRLIRRTTIALLAIGLGATGLAACSGGDQAYCDAVRSAEKQKVLSGTDYGDADAVAKAESAVSKVVDAAPDDMKVAWQAIAAGIRTNADLQNSHGKQPNDRAIKAQWKKLRQMAKAKDSIAKDTKSRCQ